MTAKNITVGARLTDEQSALLDRYVAADTLALASHGVKVTRSSVLVGCLLAREARETGAYSERMTEAHERNEPEPPKPRRAKGSG